MKVSPACNLNILYMSRAFGIIRSVPPIIQKIKIFYGKLLCWTNSYYISAIFSRLSMAKSAQLGAERDFMAVTRAKTDKTKQHKTKQSKIKQNKTKHNAPWLFSFFSIKIIPSNPPV